METFNPVTSKRARQVKRNLKRLEAEWEAEWEAGHPGEAPAPVARSRLLHKALGHERPNKKSSDLGDEGAWRQELVEAGYNPDFLDRAPIPERVSVNDLSVSGGRELCTRPGRGGVGRHGRSTPSASTSPASPPTTACARHLWSCASSCNSRQTLQEEIACPYCRPVRCPRACCTSHQPASRRCRDAVA